VRLARPGEQVLVRALNVIIKNSDLHRAVGVELRSQQDLDRCVVVKLNAVTLYQRVDDDLFQRVKKGFYASKIKGMKDGRTLG